MSGKSETKPKGKKAKYIVLSGLKLKYFVLKPRAKSCDDVYARASQNAMSAYSDTLRRASVNPKLQKDLNNWLDRESIRQEQLL